MIATPLWARCILRWKAASRRAFHSKNPPEFTLYYDKEDDDANVEDGGSLSSKPLSANSCPDTFFGFHQEKDCAKCRSTDLFIDCNNVNEDADSIVVGCKEDHTWISASPNDGANHNDRSATSAVGKGYDKHISNSCVDYLNNSCADAASKGSYDKVVHANFNLFVSASSGHIRQLEMAMDALFDLHIPQPPETYISLLQACNKFKSLSQAKQVQEHINVHGAVLTSFLGDFLVMTLAKCGAVDDAYGLYATLSHRTVFSCTAIISAYVDCGDALEALTVYYSMRDEGMEPDSYTFVSLFKACSSIQDLELGRRLHIHACKKGLTSILHVTNTLISFYGKCGAISEAVSLFSEQPKCNIVSWTTMLSAYIEQGQPSKVLRLYVQMQEEGLPPDQFALVFALQACGMMANKEQDLMMANKPSSISYVGVVQALHTEAFRKGYVCDVFVGTALITAYSKCGTLVEAENVFNMLTERNLVTWNAMLSAYIDQGQDEKALRLYVALQKVGMNPEQLTFILAFQACGNIAEKERFGNLSKTTCLEILQALRADFCQVQNLMNTVVATALMISYAKCGAVVEAETLFQVLSCGDVITWNAMLTVYVQNGQGEKALLLYRRMQDEQMTLDDVTVINALLACNETGCVDVCEHLHFGIVCAKFESSLQVVATLIHAYGNCAKMIDACASFEEVPEPDAAAWNACIAGFAGEGSYALTLRMFEETKLGGLKACEVAFTSVLSACTHTGLIVEGLEYFESMRVDHYITPDTQHYSIMVDLFARAGDFKKIENLLARIDMRCDVNTWLFLLGACHTHGNNELAKRAFSHALILQPNKATAYVLMSNIYANTEL